MVPKYRGDADDWLDQKERSNRKKKPKNRSQVLSEGEANATVVAVFQNQCRVLMDAPDRSAILCNYRRASVFQSSEIRERTPVAVGDRVLAKKSGAQDGVVEAVCARRNFLMRPAPGDESGTLVHVVAANLDVLVIVASAVNPEFSPGLVDRYLVAAQSAGIEAWICITKIDLLSQGPWKIYQDLGFRLFEVNSKAGTFISELRTELLGKTVAFCGHSGVGKTSLLRALLGHDVGAVGDVSSVTGKGTHTTTGAHLIDGPEGSQWIDTPGVRSFGLFSVEPEQLADYFPELKDRDCETTSCLHMDEAGCRVKECPRYPSYRRILESLLAGEH